MSAATTPVDPETRIGEVDGVERDVWAALREVEDPELPVSIVDLGLVYDVRVDGGRVDVDITLTYSGCPARDIIVMDAEDAIRAVDDVDSVEVSVVHSPPWSFERVTDQGRADLAEHGLAVPKQGTATCEK